MVTGIGGQWRLHSFRGHHLHGREVVHISVLDIVEFPVMVSFADCTISTSILTLLDGCLAVLLLMLPREAEAAALDRLEIVRLLLI